MLQPSATTFPAEELFTYNRRLINKLPPSFTTLWAEDHLQFGETPYFECFTTMSYFAAEFPRFRVGSLVLGQFYRNPALVAKMAANLHLLSNGRLMLGIGAGWKEDEYLAYGYPAPFPSLKTRFQQLEEAIHVIKTLWTSSPATFDGEHYQVNAAYCVPHPQPAIPLLIGGGGEKKTLALVARHADWWNFNSCPLETYAHKLTILHERCAQIGRDPATLKLSYLATVSVSEKPEEVVRVPNKHIVAGNSAQVISELEQFRALGVSHFIFRFLDPASLERFVETVAPHFS
jgi:alkanesulfonate monooxygenase SsuD/methylene tetrahydromethanopterin reductase-like flavin-dependent oxidoreductase (luciferase family)